MRLLLLVVVLPVLAAAAIVVDPSEILVQCTTTKGNVDIVVQPLRSPLGAKRFLELVDDGYFSPKLALFRCVDHFLCQFGYRPRTDVAFKKWDGATIQDDPPTHDKFKRGEISFAGGGKNTRSSHLFVTLGKHVSSLGTEPWETQIGYVTESSMENVVSKWFTGYGDMPPWGQGPKPDRIEHEGLSYLTREFPNLDYWLSCSRASNDNRNNAGGDATKPYVVKFFTNVGNFEVEIDPKAAPLGAARFNEMVESNFLNGASFFRVVKGFVAQFGLPAHPASARSFGVIKDDPVIHSNTRGTLSFAMAGPNTRTTQLFFNFGDNSRLDASGFAPFGRVLGDGMDKVLSKIYDGYGERPEQGQITRHGDEYLNKQFPLLSFILRVEMVSVPQPVSLRGHDDRSDNAPADNIPSSNVNNADTIVIPAESSSRILSGIIMAMALILGCILLVRKLILSQPPSNTKLRDKGVL